MSNTVSLRSGYEMPLLGLGVYKIDEAQIDSALRAAAQAGYRLYDTAPVYKNEEALGRAFKACGLRRDELFITSKVWNTAQRLDDVEGAFSRSLERMKLDYLDLYLIHWPVPGCYLNTWTSMLKLLDSGRVRSIGVSNFSIHHLEELKKISSLVPAVNQVEIHPLCYPKELIEYCQNSGIAIQAYAPLARGAYLDHDVMCVMAVKYGRTPAQIGLRWALQKGFSVIPKSSNPQHISVNADIFSFGIEEEDMQILDNLNEGYHCADPPEDLKDVLL